MYEMKCNQKKKVSWLTILMCMVCIGSGCTTQEEPEAKLRDLDYTVVSPEEISQTLLEVMEEKKVEGFEISYTKGEELYLAVGYGEQDTNGYSITVNAVYETESSIVIDTTLLGPGTEESIANIPTYPFVVVKIEKIDKKVDYQ